MILNAIVNAIDTAKRRNWDTLYWCVDVHGTIVIPNWDKDNLPLDCYPLALEALRAIKTFKPFKNILILSTSSHPKEIGEYMQFFADNGINFDYINCNPEVSSGSGDYGFYEDKYYFNVMIEDKAGFDPNSEWKDIIKILKQLEGV